jgi:hypothetical protein
MARIPSADDFGPRPIPQYRSPRVADQSGEIIAQAGERLMGTIANTAERITEREDKFQYAQARTALLAADVEARKALDGDQDYATHEKRYGDAMLKAREKATGMFRSKRDAALFELDAKLDVERGLGEVRNHAKRIETDVSRASLDETLQLSRNAALGASDEPTRAAFIKSATDMIDGAFEKGYLSAQEATNAKQQHVADYAESYVGMQPADKRIELLSAGKGVAKHIAPDKRVALLDAAKNESRQLNNRRESQAQFDSIIARYGTGSAAIKAARTIDDPEVRDLTESRIEHEQARTERAENEYRENIEQQATQFINDGGAFADLPLNLKNALKPGTLSSLRSYSDSLTRGTPVKTDWAVYGKLSSMVSDDPRGFGEVNMLDHRGSLADSEYEKIVDLQRKVKSGDVDGKASGFKTITQLRDDRLRKVFGATTGKGKKQEPISRFTSLFEDRLTAFKEDTGKPAKAAEAKKILDDMTAEIAVNRDYWFDTEKKAYEFKVQDIPKEELAEITSALTRRGKTVNDGTILQLYTRSLNAK